VMVFDHSMSMVNSLTLAKSTATQFTNFFAGGRDHVGLVVFTGSSYVAFPISTAFKSASPNVTTMINSLTAANGASNMSQAIWQAYGQLRVMNQPSAFNVIVFFTDGPNNSTPGPASAFTANFSPVILASAGCNNLANPINGVLLAFTRGQGASGLSDPTATSLNDVTENRSAPNSTGCKWANNPLSTGRSIRQYLSGLPSRDINGNSTNGTGSISAYMPVDLSAAGLSSDIVVNGTVNAAASNAFDDAANRIRSDSSLRPIIYVIGLGGNAGSPPDNILLKRIANDPSSTSFRASQQSGLYLLSPTSTDLRNAFLRIASSIVRLAR